MERIKIASEEPKLVRDSLAIKALTLTGADLDSEVIHFGHPIIDSVVRLLLDPKDKNIKLRRIVSFDGFDIGKVDLSKDSQRRMILRGGEIPKGGGSLKHQSATNREILEQVIDGGGKIVVGASLLQLRQIGRLLIRKSGIVAHDDSFKASSDLYFNGRQIGEVIYTIKKYNSLKSLEYLPKDLLDSMPFSHQSRAGDHPAVVSSVTAELDMQRIAPIEKGKIYISLGESFSTENIRSSNLINPATISVDYVLDVKNIKGDPTLSAARSLKLEMGKFKYEPTHKVGFDAKTKGE